MRVSNMVNIGPKATKQLRAINITESEQLMTQGALPTAAKLQEAFPNETINPLIYVGAIKGIRWRMIDPLEQARIRKTFSNMIKVTA